MYIPATIVKKNGQRFKFIVRYGDLFWYENEKTKVKETFSRYDLRLINNTKIDKLLGIQNESSGKIIVHDKATDDEFECNTQTELAKCLDVSYTTVNYAIKNRRWIKKRYFAEYKEGK